MRVLVAVVAVVWVGCASARVGAAPTSVQMADRTVAVWRPATADPAPLVLFSHGFNGCNTQSTFLMEALAAAGYLVVAPNHADASCGGGGGLPSTPFAEPASWTEATYQDRRIDVAAILTAMQADPVAWPVRWDQVGLVGHSLGGYTVLGVAGAWPSWRASGIKAVLALSPYAAPFLDTDGNLGGLGVPVQYQGGTLDLGITPTLRQPDGVYDRTASPAQYVEFRLAGHFAWTNAGSDSEKSLIIRYSRNFLDRYVRGLPTPFVRVVGVSDLRSK